MATISVCPARDAVADIVTISEGSGGKRRILLLLNSAWNVVNFRMGLLRRLLEEGYAITVATPPGPERQEIERLGCRFIPLPMQPRGRSAFSDLQLLRRLVTVMRDERPDAVLAYTAKPNIYGSFAAVMAGAPTINNIAGLGSVFNERGIALPILKMLYRLALRRSAHIFFQNGDDMAMFVRSGIVRHNLASLLPGSGVDLDAFACEPAAQNAVPRFLLVARLLREKGIAELAFASRLLRDGGIAADVRVLGFIEDDNNIYVQRAELASWQAAGHLVYEGETRDVRPHLAASDCIVLPSYYPEGTPRALIEAAATGRPIITTDTAGCRDVVEDGVTGFIVPPRDATALAGAMRRFAALSGSSRAQMGAASRALAERKFDEQIVLAHYVEAISVCIGHSRQPLGSVY